MGRTFSGVYPEWDAEHPVHLVGHSFGGNTVAALQKYLEDKVSLSFLSHFFQSIFEIIEMNFSHI